MSESKVLKMRDEIEEKCKWKVNKVFSSDEEWEKAFKELKEEAPNLKSFEGKLENAENLIKYLDIYEKISRKAEIIYVYAHLRCDEDTKNSKYQGMMSKIDSYMAEFATYTAYFVPEILEMPENFIKESIKKNPKLKIYEFLFNDILKEKPHILSK